jgi:hypothetical protein
MNNDSMLTSERKENTFEGEIRQSITSAKDLATLQLINKKQPSSSDQYSLP